jgi:AraC-like DNA-binding protein
MNRAAMNRDVAHMNIEHFHRLLADETDQTRCVVLRRLLAEEETKLKAANDLAERKLRG